MKKCSKCNIKKVYNSFSKNKTSKDGVQGICKSCSNKYSSEWKLNNPTKSKINSSKKKELLLNGFKVCTRCGVKKNVSYFHKNNNLKDRLTSNCKSCISDLGFIRRHKKREEKNKLREETKHIRELEAKKKRKLYYIKNKDKYKKRYKENKLKLNKQRNENHKHRYNSDKLYRMKSNIRSRTSNAFSKTRWNKNGSNEDMLGCSYREAYNHIEKQFKEGMSWDNQGEWHIDHIIPLASANSKEELIILCNYRNLQPLWAEDNLSKGKKCKDSDKFKMINYIKSVVCI